MSIGTGPLLRRRNFCAISVTIRLLLSNSKWTICVSSCTAKLSAVLKCLTDGHWNPRLQFLVMSFLITSAVCR